LPSGYADSQPTASSNRSTTSSPIPNNLDPDLTPRVVYTTRGTTTRTRHG
jgi:hypothetical protein